MSSTEEALSTVVKSHKEVGVSPTKDELTGPTNDEEVIGLWIDNGMRLNNQHL